MRLIKAVYEEHPSYTDNWRFTASREVYTKFAHLSNETKEYFYAVHLDSKNNVVNLDLVSMGSLNASIVHPREVFKTALLSSAAAVLFVHNHPSGDPAPSREDIELTTRLVDCGKLLGIRILDHIIIGRGSYNSMADSGIITHE